MYVQGLYGLFSFTKEEAGQTNIQNVEDFTSTSTEDAVRELFQATSILLTDTKTSSRRAKKKMA
jgi:hypothetical protein